VFEHAYLEELGGGRLRYEEMLIQAECKRLGIPVSLYTVKRIQRRQLPLTQKTFVSGDMDAMYGAMKQLGIEIPKPLDYPEPLQPYLMRKVWKATLREVETAFEQGSTAETFIKPANRQKLFTGYVVQDDRGLQKIGSVSRNQEVWCSEVVFWKSEYRVYIVQGDIVSIDHYAGDAKKPVNKKFVEEAVFVYEKSGEAPAGYAIDFGILENEETAIVEVNDGYALGAYDEINSQNYANLLFKRWAELTE
jgi:hypothetical protein